jgi:hypothetical protein
MDKWWGTAIFFGGGFTITGLAGLIVPDSGIDNGGGMVLLGAALLAWGLRGWKKARAD